MSTLVRHCSGNDDVRGSLYADGIFLSLVPTVEVYCPPIKKTRVTASIVVRGGDDQSLPPILPKRPFSLDALPYECLFEILRRLSGKKQRCLAACVSKRWLMLLSSIRVSEFDDRYKTPLPDLNEDATVGVESIKGGIYGSVVLEGRDATDTRLASTAINAGAGLVKLSIRSSSTSTYGVTNFGVRAVGRCCPSLRSLLIWNDPFIGDDGLSEIADGCHMLEKLDLCQCSSISDKGLTAIAEKCRNLVSLTIESCNNISNDSLQSVGRSCPNLQVISISNCPLVDDRGISTVVASCSASLRRIKLQNLNIGDFSVATVGYYCKEMTELVLAGVKNVGERGFWVMGNTNGLKKLTTFTISSCDGLTNLGLEAIAMGCPVLKHLRLKKCRRLFDGGLKSFTAASSNSLESLHLEECNNITHYGLLASLTNFGQKLTTLGLSQCNGIKDDVAGRISPAIPPCNNSLRSFTVRNCPGFGNASLSLIGKTCPELQNIDLRGLAGVTDEGLLPLLQTAGPKLIKVNISGCFNITDEIASGITKIHGKTLESFNLDGCKKISDKTLVAISKNCKLVTEIDVSGSSVSDDGVLALSSARQLRLEVLSLSRCSKLTNRSLPVLGNLGKSLIGLNLQRCSSISTTAIAALKEKLWWCDILS